MHKDFEKFKKRVWLHILIKCAVAGVLAGFLTVFAVLLPCRLYGVNLLWIYYVLIAVAATAAGGGVAFLVLRTSDRDIVRRLDEEFALKERVATAYEFSRYGGDMLSAQREDAENALAAIPAKSLSFKNAALTITCAALALMFIIAVPVVAVTVPPVFATTAEPEEPPREVTDWEWAALDELISDVEAGRKAASVDAASRAVILARLKGLRNVLLNGVTQSSLENFVQSAVTGIRNGIRDVNEGLPADSAQKDVNLNGGEEVISELYRIFKINSDNNNGGGDDDPNKPDEGDPNKPGNGQTGTGDLNISDLPFFDRDKGFVKCGEVRDEYYEKAQAALKEGLISDEEWALIMATYFTDLNDKD